MDHQRDEQRSISCGHHAGRSCAKQRHGAYEYHRDYSCHYEQRHSCHWREQQRATSSDDPGKFNDTTQRCATGSR